MTSADHWEVARERARERAVAALRRDIASRFPYCAPGDSLVDALLGSDPRWRAEYGKIMDPAWIPPRRGRNMPVPWEIAAYWHERGLPPDGRLEVPFCFRCFCVFRFDPDARPEDRWNGAALERAHLVDRIRGGLDGPQNLMPLCHRCHKVMPSFDPGEGPDAIAWVLRDDRPRLLIVQSGDARKFLHYAAETALARKLTGEYSWEPNDALTGRMPSDALTARPP